MIEALKDIARIFVDMMRDPLFWKCVAVAAFVMAVAFVAVVAASRWTS